MYGSGSYRGQWLQGSRHGFGIRQSVPYGVAVHYRHRNTHATSSSQSSIHSNDDERAPATGGWSRRPRDQGRGGFVLVASSAGVQPESTTGTTATGLRGVVARTLRLRRQASAGEVSAGTSRVGRRPGRDGSGSRSASEDREFVHTDSCTSFISQVQWLFYTIKKTQTEKLTTEICTYAEIPVDNE